MCKDKQPWIATVDQLCYWNNIHIWTTRWLKTLTVVKPIKQLIVNIKLLSHEFSFYKYDGICLHAECYGSRVLLYPDLYFILICHDAGVYAYN